MSNPKTDKELRSEETDLFCLGSVYLSAGSHFDLGHTFWPVGEHIYVHLKTNEEVLFCCLQEVFQEYDIPVQKVTGHLQVKGQTEMLCSGWYGTHSVITSYLLSNSKHRSCDCDVLQFVDAVK